MGRLKGYTVQLGENLPNSDLYRQFVDGKEIAPRYCGQKLCGRVDEAIEQAGKLGWKCVHVDDYKLINVSGEWYNFPGVKEKDAE